MSPTPVDGAPARGLALTLTPMRRRHLAAVLRIEAAVYPRPWSERLFHTEIDLRSRCYIVARVGPTVVGYAGLLLIDDDGHITTVAVDAAWRRHGIGTRLLLELCRQGTARGVHQLTLEVRTSNRGAQEMYRHFGFAPAGVRKAYYADNREDALVMWAHDVATPAYAERLAALADALPGTVHREGFGPADPLAGGPDHPSGGRMPEA
ncbi:MAG: ribosomal-protein-alanine acetyltransferase [Acidimicrobiales bacterium]|nr:ribosomal-protein-alanine acetyltransferase [Acidimicrobiales bacterium]